MRRTVIAVLGLAFLSSASAARAEVKFAAPPTAKIAGDRVEISFALSEASDVEVAIVDGQGQVVRHLAAGMVGGQAVAPPLVPGLAQTLTWDRKDDLGKPVAGAVSVRVRAGMAVAPDGSVGDGPYYVARVRGMTVDPAGNCYVLQQAYDGHFFGPYDIRVFDRSGKYLRTIMPVSATAAKADVAAFNPIEAPGASLVPRNFYSVWPDLYPYGQDQGLRLSPTMTADGRLLLNDDVFRRLYTLRAADGCAADGQFGQDLWPKSVRVPRSGSPMTVIAPGGRTLYSAGIAAAAPKGERANKDWPDGRIYKFSLGSLAEGGQVFATVEMPEKAKPPTGGWTADGSRAAIQGLAVDAKGNVYAADCANGKVHKFDSAGKLLASADVPDAFQLVVNDKTGAIYVLASKERGQGKMLVKLNSCEAGAKPAATLNLGADDAATPFIAGDFTADPPQIWIATGSHLPRRPGEGNDINPYGRTSSLFRIKDSGDKLEEVQDLAEQARFTIPGVDRLAVDPKTDDLYINDGWYSIYRFNGLTGKYIGPLVKDRPSPVMATELTVGPDGYVYVQKGANWNGPIERLSKDLLNPVGADGGKSVVGMVYGRYGGGVGEKGICVGYDNTIYALGFYTWASYFVSAFDPTGKPIEGRFLAGKVQYGPAKTGVLGPLPARCGGIRADREGCLYVGIHGLPGDYRKPGGFEKDTAYGQMVGSVVKFKKTGGQQVGGQATGDVTSLGGNRLEGVERVYPGLAPFSGWLRSDACVCRSPRFDLDAYGRLYIPNAVTFSVQVVDNAGNVILSFGQYGNYDNGTAAATNSAGAAIPLGWPISAAVSDARLYIGDLLNRRVVRVKPAWRLEQTCRIE